MIRRATAEDIPRIIELGRGNHAAVSNAPFDADAATGFVRYVLANGAVFLSGGGMIGGLIHPLWSAPSERQAWEMFWHATDGSGLRLLKAFQSWAHENGATTHFTTTRESPALERMGFTRQKIAYGEPSCV